MSKPEVVLRLEVMLRNILIRFTREFLSGKQIKSRS